MIVPISALLLHVKTGKEDDNLETCVLSTESSMESIDRPEVFPVPTVAVAYNSRAVSLELSHFFFPRLQLWHFDRPLCLQSV